MSLSSEGRNALLSGGLSDSITHLSLHSGHPGETGTNELAGSPYARKTVVWTAPDNGVVSNDGALSFDITADTEVLFVGMWSALAAGTFFGAFPLNSPVAGVATALASSNVITNYDHSLVSGDRVFISAVFDASLLGGISESSTYYLRDVTADTFKLSLTDGGPAINITSDGEVMFQKVLPEFFGAEGFLGIADGALVLDARVL